MSAAPSLCENPCETCAKEGLPLLLTRYALMPSEISAPRLTAQLNSPELAKVPLGNGAHYGLRLLRSGYVYVFDEKRNHWDEYFVTADGYLTKLPTRSVIKIRQPVATEFRCARNGAAPLAGVITIRNAKHAGKVWIAFSDVEWTDAVFKAHQSADVRQRHMTCVTVTAGAGKVAAQPDTAPLEQLDQVVTEFKLDGRRAAAQFGRASPHAYNARQGSASALLQAAEQVRPGGGAAVVALHDPVGLAMEIATLAELRKVTFMHHEATAKPRLAASTIASLEPTIREQAKLAEIAAGEELADQVMRDAPIGGAAAAERLRTQSPASLHRAAEVAWKRYTHKRTGEPRFDGAASEGWLKGYNNGLRKFDAEHIAPLARAHVAWLQHDCMVDHLDCNYDRHDLGSGAAYTACVAAMLRLTCDKQPSYDQYLRWLQDGDTSAARNLVMRALGFNQDKLLVEIQKVDQAPMDKRAFPTDMLLGHAKDLLEKLPEGGRAALADLLQTVGGPLFRNMDHLSKGGPAVRAIAAVAAVSGVQFAMVDITLKRDKFIQHLLQSVMQVDPKMKVTHGEMGRAVKAQLQLLQIEGLPLQGSSKRKWLVVLDKSSIKSMAAQAGASGMSGDALAAQLARSIRQSSELPKLKAEAFKAGVSGPTFNATGAVVIGLVQGYNLTKLVSDYRQGMAHEKSEALARLALGATALVGSIGEAAGLALERAQAAKLRNAPGLGVSRVPNVLRVGGRLLGLGAGLLMAVVDLMKGQEEAVKGDVGLARAYRVSAALGAGLGVALFLAGSIPLIGWLVVGVAVVALIGVTIWIEKNKDNKMQEWLMRCHFGTNTDKYETHGKQAEELELVFA
jgi:hypothetical protein